METEETDGHRTILGNMLNAIDPETGEKLSDDDVVANAALLVYHMVVVIAYLSFAASDTTAVGLTFTLYFLLANRESWTRLCKEIRAKYHSLDEITHLSTTTIPFLDAVIQEGKAIFRRY
jgi:cytochrome P450